MSQADTAVRVEPTVSIPEHSGAEHIYIDGEEHTVPKEGVYSQVGNEETGAGTLKVVNGLITVYNGRKVEPPTSVHALSLAKKRAKGARVWLTEEGEEYVKTEAPKLTEVLDTNPPEEPAEAEKGTAPIDDPEDVGGGEANLEAEHAEPDLEKLGEVYVHTRAAFFKQIQEELRLVYETHKKKIDEHPFGKWTLNATPEHFRKAVTKSDGSWEQPLGTPTRRDEYQLKLERTLALRSEYLAARDAWLIATFGAPDTWTAEEAQEKALAVANIIENDETLSRIFIRATFINAGSDEEALAKAGHSVLKEELLETRKEFIKAYSVELARQRQERMNTFGKRVWGTLKDLGATFTTWKGRSKEFLFSEKDAQESAAYKSAEAQYEEVLGRYLDSLLASTKSLKAVADAERKERDVLKEWKRHNMVQRVLGKGILYTLGGGALAAAWAALGLVTFPIIVAMGIALKKFIISPITHGLFVKKNEQKLDALGQQKGMEARRTAEYRQLYKERSRSVRNKRIADYTLSTAVSIAIGIWRNEQLFNFEKWLGNFLHDTFGWGESGEQLGAFLHDPMNWHFRENMRAFFGEKVAPFFGKLFGSAASAVQGWNLDSIMNLFGGSSDTAGAEGSIGLTPNAGSESLTENLDTRFDAAFAGASDEAREAFHNLAAQHPDTADKILKNFAYLNEGGSAKLIEVIKTAATATEATDPGGDASLQEAISHPPSKEVPVKIPSWFQEALNAKGTKELSGHAAIVAKEIGGWIPENTTVEDGRAILDGKADSLALREGDKLLLKKPDGTIVAEATFGKDHCTGLIALIKHLINNVENPADFTGGDLVLARGKESITLIDPSGETYPERIAHLLIDTESCAPTPAAPSEATPNPPAAIVPPAVSVIPYSPEVCNGLPGVKAAYYTTSSLTGGVGPAGGLPLGERTVVVDFTGTKESAQELITSEKFQSWLEARGISPRHDFLFFRFDVDGDCAFDAFECIRADGHGEWSTAYADPYQKIEITPENSDAAVNGRLTPKYTFSQGGAVPLNHDIESSADAFLERTPEEAKRAFFRNILAVLEPSLKNDPAGLDNFFQSEPFQKFLDNPLPRGFIDEGGSEERAVALADAYGFSGSEARALADVVNEYAVGRDSSYRWGDEGGPAFGNPEAVKEELVGEDGKTKTGAQFFNDVFDTMAKSGQFGRVEGYEFHGTWTGVDERQVNGLTPEAQNRFPTLAAPAATFSEMYYYATHSKSVAEAFLLGRVSLAEDMGMNPTSPEFEHVMAQSIPAEFHTEGTFNDKVAVLEKSFGITEKQAQALANELMSVTQGSYRLDPEYLPAFRAILEQNGHDPRFLQWAFNKKYDAWHLMRHWYDQLPEDQKSLGGRLSRYEAKQLAKAAWDMAYGNDAPGHVWDNPRWAEGSRSLPFKVPYQEGDTSNDLLYRYMEKYRAGPAGISVDAQPVEPEKIRTALQNKAALGGVERVNPEGAPESGNERAGFNPSKHDASVAVGGGAVITDPGTYNHAVAVAQANGYTYVGNGTYAGAHFTIMIPQDAYYKYQLSLGASVTKALGPDVGIQIAGGASITETGNPIPFASSQVYFPIAKDLGNAGRWEIHGSVGVGASFADGASPYGTAAIEVIKHGRTGWGPTWHGRVSFVGAGNVGFPLILIWRDAVPGPDLNGLIGPDGKEIIPPWDGGDAETGTPYGTRNNTGAVPAVPEYAPVIDTTKTGEWWNALSSTDKLIYQHNAHVFLARVAELNDMTRLEAAQAYLADRNLPSSNEAVRNAARLIVDMESMQRDTAAEVPAILHR